MSFEDLSNRLILMFAFDVCYGGYSGLDRGEVRDGLPSITREQWASFVCKHFVGPAAVDEGYGLEDLREFLEWLSDYMDFAL